MYPLEQIPQFALSCTLDFLIECRAPCRTVSSLKKKIDKFIQIYYKKRNLSGVDAFPCNKSTNFCNIPQSGCRSWISCADVGTGSKMVSNIIQRWTRFLKVNRWLNHFRQYSTPSGFRMSKCSLHVIRRSLPVWKINHWPIFKKEIEWYRVHFFFGPRPRLPLFLYIS